MIEFHLSVTSGSSRERTRAAHLIDRDANDCAIPPPPGSIYDCEEGSKCIRKGEGGMGGSRGEGGMGEMMEESGSEKAKGLK